MKDLKREYGKWFRIGMAGSLLFHIALFYFAPKEFKVTPYKPRKKVELIAEQIDTKVLEEKIEAPPKPALPVAAETEKEVEASTVAPTTGEVFEHYKAPEQAVEIETLPFYKVEKKPKVIYRYFPAYPELARKAEIEGRVVVRATVGIDGRVESVTIMKSSGNALLDSAAVDAARKWKFTPGYQRDRPVRVWIAIPFVFTLE